MEAKKLHMVTDTIKHRENDRIGSIDPRSLNKVYLSVLAVIGLGSLDQSIVASAIPSITRDLGGLSNSSWVITIYILASTASMPVYGRLGDQYGRRPVIIGAIVTFLVGSLLGGLSHSLTTLILSRFLQGLGAGAFVPVSQAIIADLIPPAERGKKQGGVAAVFTAASVLGPLLGGALTDLLSWHWIFFANLPIGIMALGYIIALLPSSSPRGKHRIDWLGSGLLVVSVSSYLMTLNTFGRHSNVTADLTVPLVVLCAVAASLLILRINRADSSLIPRHLFANKVFVAASAVMTFLYLGLVTVFYFIPVYAQLVIGYGATQSGLVIVPFAVGAVAGSIGSGRMLTRTRRYKPTQLAGLVLAVASLALTAHAVSVGAATILLEAEILALGLGAGLVMPNMTVAVQNALPLEQRGIGTAMLVFFRSLGGLLGAALASALISNRLTAGNLGGQDEAEAYRAAIALSFWVGAGALLIALLFLLRLPELPLTTGSSKNK